MQPTKPVDVIRDGYLKASIWQNENENGPYFTATFARSYRDQDGKWHDSQSFFRADLLRIAELGRQAYSRIAELGRQQAQTRQAGQTQQPHEMTKETFKEQRMGMQGQQNGRSRAF